MTKLVLIADTHGRNDLLDGLPDGDVLIHCGDCTRYGSRAGLQEFVEIYGALPHKKKILIAGNHDGCFQKHPKEARAIVKDARVTYLEDDNIRINGLNYWGIPWTPTFNNWWFMGDEDFLAEKWAQIPASVDVIISHGPPAGILDGPEVAGSQSQADIVDILLRPRLNVFGHIHEGYGYHKKNGITYVNCSLLNEAYVPGNKPIVLYLDALRDLPAI